MKILYLDCFLGFESEMLLGALISSGADSSAVESELKAAFPAAKLCVSDVRRCSVEAIRADISMENSKTLSESETIEYISSKITDDAAALFLQRTAEVYFVSKQGILDEICLCRLYALHCALRQINADYVICSSLKEGSGFVEENGSCAVIPSPAVLEILSTCKIPFSSIDLQKELIPANDAAALAKIANEYGTMPEMDIEKIGYGAGREDLSAPNLIRAVIGSSRDTGFNRMFESSDLFLEFADELTMI